MEKAGIKHQRCDGASSLLPQGMGEKLPPQLALITQVDDRRRELEQFIANKFSSRYDANIQEFLPVFLAIRSHQVDAVLGLRRGTQGAPLFLEYYLPAAAEEVLAEVLGREVTRSSLVEIGNLVSHGGGQSQMLFVALTAFLCREAAEWAIFTATPEVCKLLHRLHLNQHFLAEADGARLGDKLKDWGSYYHRRPEVVAVNAYQAYRTLSRQPLGRLLLANCEQQLEGIAAKGALF